MKFLEKTITSSLIVALVSFAGSFCLHPMAVQAASNTMDMPMEGQGIEVSVHMMQIGDASASALNTCTFNCVSTMPQAVATKKTSVDSIPNVLIALSQTEGPLFFELYSDPFDAGGTSPPSPDILFSVVKKE